MARILALVPYLPGTAGGQRTSIEAWKPVLERHGFEVDLVPFESERAELTGGRSYLSKAVGFGLAVGRRAALLRHLDRYDMAFVHREAALAGPEVIERIVASRLPLVYGLDDPLFVPYRSPTNGWLSLLKFPGKVARICAAASCVIVNGPPLADYARRYCSNVVVIPNLVDEGRYRPHEAAPRETRRLGWIGSPTTASNLDLIAPSLERLAQERTFELVLVGSDRQRVGNLEAQVVPWSADTEVDLLRSFDVGLVPLDAHPWNPWKFNYKLAQYMVLGIPAVCTPIGSNRHIIDHGVNGFLADTTDEWVECLRLLLDDTDLRAKVGLAAAEYAGRHFTVEANEGNILLAFASY